MREAWGTRGAHAAARRVRKRADSLSEEESRGRERADADACPAAVAAALLPCVLFFRPPPFGGGGRIWERVRAISIARL